MAECESCGYRFASSDLVRVAFDDDLRGARRMLERDPLVEACRNCGSPVVVAVAAALLDEPSRFAACLAVADRGAASIEDLRESLGPDWRFDVQSRPEGLVRAVRTHFESIADQVDDLWERQVRGIGKASPRKVATLIGSGAGTMPSRPMLNALGLLEGERLDQAKGVSPLIALRASRQALARGEDASVALDATVPAWLVDGPAIAFLLELGMETAPDAPLEDRAAPVLAAAWASDRGPSGFPPPGPALWANCVVDWLDQRAGAAAAIGPDDFLLRTVDNVQIANVAVVKLFENAERASLLDSIERRGLFGGIDFLAHLDRFRARAEADR